MTAFDLPRRWICRAARHCVPCLISLALSSCSLNILNPAGPVGRGNAAILLDATAVMLAIVVPTIVLAFWMAWHYRASNTSADYLPYWSYSGRIEAVVWSIPILTIMFIGGLIWIGSHRLDPFRPLPSNSPPLEVQVVSLDWKWLFIYPEQGVASINRLVVPSGRPVHFSITSTSVFNAFFVPRLGSMIYAMPGMVSQLHLQADHPETMWGISAQFSGDGFSDMQFDVSSLPTADFTSWFDRIRSGEAILDRDSFKALMQQSQRVEQATYRVQDPGLFDDIVRQAIPRGPGPQPETPGHAGREVSTGGKD
ncbi:ubiquinol oxidase subunit II [Rhizobium sp. BK418]|uniref:ubiquinol oxidase subunit II n=1 Tax=Rhizobium sp. BK418 TaxID=2512120 RepID=UPI0010514194|nr:ubiquinol oxidase subunit II [Rhizobium sp. BK418]TCR96368.1 cytochrome bb3 quinol oxidase subunit 2 [Rhizobium sp. BK418]